MEKASTGGVYFIETPDRSQFLHRGTTEGQKAIPLFKSKEAAQRMIDAGDIKGMIPVHRDIQSTYQLLSTAKSQGVTMVVSLTGNEDEADVKPVPIDALLLALDLSIG